MVFIGLFHSLVVSGILELQPLTEAAQLELFAAVQYVTLQLAARCLFGGVSAEACMLSLMVTVYYQPVVSRTTLVHISMCEGFRARCIKASLIA